mmetsp:Transcript_17209/g.41108  ORF Transcript_17209/g.41108 Transcript_17209/m.41108 type:complete len:262 (-) Transcript_17209:635-1420(-)
MQSVSCTSYSRDFTLGYASRATFCPKVSNLLGDGGSCRLRCAHLSTGVCSRCVNRCKASIRGAHPLRGWYAKNEKTVFCRSCVCIAAYSFKPSSRYTSSGLRFAYAFSPAKSLTNPIAFMCAFHSVSVCVSARKRIVSTPSPARIASSSATLASTAASAAVSAAPAAPSLAPRSFAPSIASEGKNWRSFFSSFSASSSDGGAAGGQLAARMSPTTPFAIARSVACASEAEACTIAARVAYASSRCRASTSSNSKSFLRSSK